MRNRLPRPRELAFFVVLAVVCTAIVGATRQYDVALALLGGPVFLVAAVMGLRRSMEAEAARVPVEVTTEPARAPADLPDSAG